MKKNTFMEGALIATIGIIIVKVIGLIYVIPFNAIIGETGGALYGYGYNIYTLFLAISSAGFPFAISKMTSEYLSLGDKKAVYDTYKIATKLIMIISFVVFLVLFIFAKDFAFLIIGNATGNNSLDDIAFVIRIVSFAILVIPFLSVTKGYLQGHKFITPTSISQIIEQIVRVIVILVGSYLALNVFKLGMKNAVGVAVFGAFVGGLFAFIYLRVKIKKAKLLNKPKEKSKVTKKEIISKIIKYSIPFIAISLIYNLYNTVDMILLSRTMNDILGYSGTATESVLSVFTAWGVKLNNILLAVTTGITTSLIPNIVSSYTKGDMDDVDNKFNTAVQCVLLAIVPITLFLSLLSEPVWTLFYGNSEYGPIIYKVFVYCALFGGFQTIVTNTLQGLNKYKLVIITVFTGLLINTGLDVPLMILAEKLSFPPAWGAVAAAIIGYSISILASFIVLNKKYNFNFKDTIKRLPKYLVSWACFVIVIMLLKLVLPQVTGRLAQIPILLVYGIVSFGIYMLVNYFFGNLNILSEFTRRLKK